MVFTALQAGVAREEHPGCQLIIEFNFQLYNIVDQAKKKTFRTSRAKNLTSRTILMRMNAWDCSPLLVVSYFADAEVH